MKTLLILRHAKSSWDNATLNDHDRPLNERGKADAPRMGQLLKAEGLLPDLILTSSAERALATAEAVVSACGYEKELRVEHQLYHAYPNTYCAVLQELGDEYGRVLVVGHNPGLELWLAELTGQEVVMPTAALAQVELAIPHWRDLNTATTGQLVHLWRPKEVSE